MEYPQMARKPYRIKPTDNPLDFGRITLPVGALSSRGPGDAVSASLGAGFGMAPAAPQPSIFQNALTALNFPTQQVAPAFQQIGDTFQRLYTGIPAATRAAVNDINPYNVPYGVQNRANIQAIGRYEPTPNAPTNDITPSGQVPPPMGDGTHNFPRNPSGLEHIAQGFPPPVISVAVADRSGNLEDLLAVGYTMRNGTLYAPPGLVEQGQQAVQQQANTQGSSPQGQNTTIGLMGRNHPNGQYGARGDKWVTSEKAATSFWRRKQRQYNEAQDRPQQSQQQRREYRAYGLVNLNVSAG